MPDNPLVESGKTGASNETNARTPEARSARDVDAAQKVTENLIKDTERVVSADPEYRKSYMSQLNKELEDKKILPVLALSLVNKEFSEISHGDGFVDKNHIDRYIKDKEASGEMTEDSASVMLLRRAGESIGNRRFEAKAVREKILDGEESVQKQAVKDATGAAKLLTAERTGAGVGKTLLDDIDAAGNGGNDGNNDRRVGRAEIDKYLNSDAAKRLDPEQRAALAGLVRDWDTPAVQAMLTEHAPGQTAYLSLNSADSNTLDKYLKKQDDDQKTDDRKGRHRRDAEPAAPAIPVRSDLPVEGARNDQGYLVKGWTQLDKADQWGHNSYFSDGQGYTVSIDKDSEGNTIGVTTGLNGTYEGWKYNKERQTWTLYGGKDGQLAIAEAKGEDGIRVSTDGKLIRQNVTMLNERTPD
ncbi:MAG: hypothetical protein JST89_26280 [Cyanobacteria bacterium SZAS-4]|nr:hypothetical protein [Cyanobacteria bacterium SZAS-4]